MRIFVSHTRLVAAFFVLIALSGASFPQKRTNRNEDKLVLDPVVSRKDLYPAGAEAKKEITEALQRAVAERKRVLLVFGANWCYDCHVLDRALHEGEAGRVISQSFLVVHVDIGEGDKNLDLVKQYKTTLDKGVPVVVVLNRDGRVLYGSDDGEFESARTMMKKDLLSFLIRWRAGRQG